MLRRPAPTRASSLRVFSKKQPRCCVFFVGDWKTRRLETQPGTWRVRLEFRVRWPHFAPRPISRRSSVRPCQRFFCEPARRVTVTGATEGWKVLVATAPAPRIRIFWLFSQLASPTHLLHHSRPESRHFACCSVSTPDHRYHGFRGAGQHPTHVAAPDISGQSQVWGAPRSQVYCLSPCLQRIQRMQSV